MGTSVILPRVDMDMEAGRIGRWFFDDGVQVCKGDPLFEIETSKATMEIEAPASGLLRVVAKAGDELPVGTVVGWIDAPNEEPHVTPSAAVKERIAGPVRPSACDMQARIEDRTSEGLWPDVRATPSARRLAREQAKDLRTVLGSGPNGRIQAADVLAAEPASASRDGISLHRLWLSRGNGTPVVLLHGLGADLNAWRPLASVLRGRPILALDLPGHGRSPWNGSAAFETIVDAMEAVLLDEGASSCHLVGHSLGGGISAALAHRPGLAARSLTLISPAGLGADVNGAFLAGFLRARSEESLAPWMRLLVGDEAALDPTMVKTTLHQRVRHPLASAQEKLVVTLFPDGTQAFSIRHLIENTRIPTKVIFGLDDRIIPAWHGSGLPGMIALHLFAGVGHMPHFEVPNEVARLIEDTVAAGDQRPRAVSSRGAEVHEVRAIS